MRSAAVKAGVLDVCKSAEGLTHTTATARPAVPHVWCRHKCMLCNAECYCLKAFSNALLLYSLRVRRSDGQLG